MPRTLSGWNQYFFFRLVRSSVEKNNIIIMVDEKRKRKNPARKWFYFPSCILHSGGISEKIERWCEFDRHFHLIYFISCPLMETHSNIRVGRYIPIPLAIFDKILLHGWTRKLENVFDEFTFPKIIRSFNGPI